MLGAGTAIGLGGDDFKWVTAWRTVPKKEIRIIVTKAKADGILVEEAESTGAVILLVGGRPQWNQWTD